MAVANVDQWVIEIIEERKKAKNERPLPVVA
jgi:hypothetical protein